MPVRAMSIVVLTALASSLFIFSPKVAATETAPTFKVTENLTLGEISRILYGTVKRAKEIARINQLKNPDLILVGQVLKLPEAATNSDTAQAETLKEIREKKTTAKPAATNTVTTTPQAEASAADLVAIKSAREELTKFLADEEANQTADQKSARATLLQGEEKLRAKDYASAIKLFNESRTKNPGELSAWFQEIKSAKDSGDVASAKRMKKDFLERYPQLSEVPFLKGVE